MCGPSTEDTDCIAAHLKVCNNNPGVWKDEHFLRLVHNSLQCSLINPGTETQKTVVSPCDIQLLNDVWAHCEVAVHMRSLVVSVLNQRSRGRGFESHWLQVVT